MKENVLNPGELRRLRQKLYLSQEQMAALVGVCGATVHRWETGRHRPSLLAREKLVAVVMKAEEE